MAQTYDARGVEFGSVPNGDAATEWHPLAAIQRSLWFLYKLQPELQGNYNLVFEALCRPAMAEAELRDAIAQLVARHSMMRARFAEFDGEPMQTVDDVVPVAVEVVLASGMSDEELAAAMKRDRLRAFDVTRAPLMRAGLYVRDANECALLLVFDHLAFDGWSLFLMTRELGELLSSKKPADVVFGPAAPPEFFQHVAEQKSWLTSRRGEKQFAYWKSVLEEPFPPLALRSDLQLGAGVAERREALSVVLPVALSDELRAFSVRHGVSLFVSFLASYFILLHRLTQEDRVAVGSAMPARSVAWKRTFGNFVNPVVLRSRLRAQDGTAATVAEFVKATNSVAWGALRNQEYPLAELAERLKPERAADGQPYFQAFFVFHNLREDADMGRILSNTAGRTVAWGGRELEAIGSFQSAGSANLDLVLETGDIGETLWAALDFDACKFSAEAARRLVDTWVAILGGMVADDARPVARLPVMSEAERRRVLEEWTGARVEYPLEQCIHEVFEAQVERTPDATAVVHGAKRVSYAELNARANRLARHLRSVGVGPDERVGLCVERGIEMVVALLGTLKAGGAYVPLDPAYPRERLEYMLADAEPVVILGHGTGVSMVKELTSIPVMDVGSEEGWAELSEANIDVKESGQSSRQVAYLIYTSGSTGAPKGVVIEHRGLVNYTLEAVKWFGLGAGGVVYQQNSLNFDLSVEEMLPTLVSGATLLVCDEWFGLGGKVERVRPTIVHLTAAHFHTLVSEWAEAPERAQEELAGVRLVNVTGDALSAEKVAAWDRLRPAETRLINTYGPTEATVSCSAAYVQHDAEKRVTIGKPFGNTPIYILDSEGEPVPIGAVGELYIGGEQVARGYWKRPELTAERFVRDPFSEQAGARMYKTGDHGRWLGNGEIEFLGRNDHQVKVRGFRIELGEVEARLSSAAGVSELVVVATGQGEEKRLVVYYAGADAPDGEGLREYARKVLPEYMVPSGYKRLVELPQTPNGKIDRKALAALTNDGETRSSEGYEAPCGETERALAEIWREALKVERVGRHDNFFELGGHSLLAVTLIERMRRAGMHTDVRSLLLSPTVASVAAVVGGESSEVEVPPNRIPADAREITPEMLPLVKLSREALARIASQVPSGAANIQDIYPLAPLQEGILFHHMMHPVGDVYLEACLFEMPSRERVQAFLAALETVIGRHDILRTGFLWEGLEEPVQVVLRQATLPVDEVALDAARGDGVGALERRYDRRRFRIDVREAPLVRCAVAEDRANRRWLVRLMTHHLATDHVSVELLMDEVRRLMADPLTALPEAAPFRNYVAQARLGVNEEGHERFFKGMLGDVDEPTTPFGLLGVHGNGLEIDEAKQQLDPELAKRVRRAARTLGVSAASVMHFAWGLVVGRVSGRSDVVFGTVLFGRMQGGKNADRTIGLLMNTLPLRVKIGETNAAQSVRATHAELAELVRHEHARLSLAQRCSGIAAPAPLFTALLNYRHSDVGTAERAELRSQGIVELGAEERSNYPLTLTIDDYGKEFGLTAQVTAAVGGARVCAYMVETIENLVMALERDPTLAVCRIEVLPREEREQVVLGFNATSVEYGEDACLAELFEAEAKRRPDAEAVVCGQERVTYGELNRRANRLAHHLRRLGVGPDDRVALCVDRSVDMVVGLLGTLKAGGAYVPLDPAYPRERLLYVLQDSDPAVVLVHGATQSLLEEWADGWVIGWVDGRRVIDLDEDRAEWKALPEKNLSREAIGLRPDHLAYVIYTSGSTGQPKGAMNEHRGVVNRLRWMQDRYGLTEADAVIQKTPFSFDVSVWEFFWPLASGARLVMARPEGHKDPNYLSELIEREGVTTAHFVPSMLQVFLEQNCFDMCRSLLRVMCSGEPLAATLAARFHERLPNVELHNLYGPTEAAVDVTSWACEAGATRSFVPIGTPIANTQIYILDESRRPVPVGVTGELHIGGVQVGRGYWKRPELTAERFVSDPFSEEAGARMYKTGDLGRWLPDGAIEYLGRNDFQVKVRGFRIELGEIESRLGSAEGVSEVVVVARDDGNGEKQLVAYYTGNRAPTVEELRAHARAALPEYMVPSAYARLDALPLSANGKLDRRALPAPDHDAFAAREYEAPQGEVEEQLGQIWSTVLKVDRVGRNDNFFELGGHSLLAVQLATRVEKALNRRVSLGAVFAHPVLRDLAISLVESASADLTPIPTTDRTGYLPLSPAQRRLWFLSQFEGASQAYHIHGSLRLGGAVESIALRRALHRVVSRHESLRTRFVVVEGEPMQVVDGEGRLEWREEDLRGRADSEAALADLAGRESNAPFDLEVGPLVRTCLVHLDQGGHVLLVTMHHIVSDGWSMNVLEHEVSALYSAFTQGGVESLEALPIQYGDYAAWQREQLSGQRLEELSNYWRDALRGAPVRIELPTDRPRPLEQDYAGANVEIEIDASLARAIGELSRRHGVTQYMTVLAAWGALLARLSGQTDVVIGSPFAARNRPEIEPLIGFFVNTLPIRLGVDSESVGDLLTQTKARVLAAQEHQDLPLDLIVDVVQPPRSLSHTPLFQVLLAWQSSAERFSGIGDVRASLDESVDTTAQFDLTLSLEEFEGGIRGSLNYPTALYARGTIERFGTYFVNVLRGMVRDDSQAVARLPLMSEVERRQVLEASRGADVKYPLEQCVHEVFEARAERTPDATAVAHGETQVSYAELNARANRLARHLRRLGVGPDARVGLCLERGVDLVVGLLAVWKAGGAYVPLDPAYPKERTSRMVEDSLPVVILSHGPARSILAEAAVGVPIVELEVDDGWRNESSENLAPAELGLTSRHLAYVIYTSGSTGRPKGVMVEHRSLLNYALDTMRWFELRETDRVLQQNSPNFDLSIDETLPTLLSGATLVPSREFLGSGGSAALEELTFLHLSTAHFHTLVSEWNQDPEAAREQLRNIRMINVAGDALSMQKLEQWDALRPDGIKLINTYGPAETTVTCSAAYVKHESGATSVSIGTPFANTQIYVLDRYQEAVPVGVVGEIYIGGRGVARGYLNQPDLTSERFLKSPFVAAHEDGRMYKTGDLGRWLPNGTLEFAGRRDFQVKVRGFRIELEEVEATLASVAGVFEVVVLARQDQPGDKRLVAYYTGHDAPDADALRSHASQALPEYMVPSAYVRLDRLPLTPNGKVDRKTLAAQTGDGNDEGSPRYEAPRGETERMLAQIWGQVLKVDRVGRHDNFFALGGHSLLAVTLIERMRRAGLHTDVRTLLLSPTLASVAATAGGESREMAVPPNRIPAGAREITPEMLPLVKLSHEAIKRIADKVQGGAENIQDIYPLAPLQEGLLFHHMMHPVGDVYVEACLLGMDSRERVDGFLTALQAVIDRHDVLRTGFLWEGLEEPVQVVLRQAKLPVEEVWLDGTKGEGAEELERRYDRRQYRIDVTEAPLVRCVVAEDRRNGRWLVRLMTHHVATDHVSVELLMDEARRLMAEPSSTLPEAVPFRNFVAQSRLGMTEEAHERFFREMLGDVDEPTAPFGLLGVYGDGTEIDESKQMLPSSLARRVRVQARKLGVSAASVMHLGWGMVLGRVSGRADVVFGTVLFGRTQGGRNADRAIGLLMNTLPLRLEIGEANAKKSVRATHAQLTDLVRHEHARLSLAQRCSGIPAPAPLFSALLNYRHSEGSTADGVELGSQGIVDLGTEERSNYPLTLTIDDYGEGFELTAQVTAAVGAARVCAYLAEAVENLVTALERDPEVGVCRIEVLPRVEREQVIHGFNAAVGCDADVCLAELFEAEAKRRPWAEAVVCAEERVSYGELNRRANQLAHHLRSLGVKPDALVAICMDRGVDMIVALLATLKAGGAYVPLDPAYPADRLSFSIADSAPLVILVDDAGRSALAEMALQSSLQFVDLKADADLWAGAPEENVSREVSGLRPEHLAYVIYTSGSTGRPKGVMVEHRNVTRLFAATDAWFEFDARDVWTLFHSFAFDFSVWEIWGALSKGGSLVVVPLDVARSPADFYELLCSQGVTVLNQTPSAFQPLVLAQARSASAHHLRHVIFGGEALELRTLEPWYAEHRNRDTVLVNMYGITETTVHVTYRPLSPTETRRQGPSPIGRRIPDLRSYVLDAQCRPVPIGVSGELYVGGAGVARGYLNRPELTAERFLLDPFCGASAPNARMYKTGDLARWLPDGTLEYLGRNDSQVKIRGFRIELSEIESRLASAAGVSEVVVVARDDGSGEKRLVAYFTGEVAPTPEELRAHARTALPEYMVPVAYVRLDALPLTANGKLDGRALPVPDHAALAAGDYEAPLGEVEGHLAQIWSEVLKVDRVGRNDNFFELGGHSLLVVQLATRAEKVLNRRVSLSAIFDRPVLRDLATSLVDDAFTAFVPIPATDRSGYLPLSLAQRRLWFLSQFEAASQAYHIHGNLRLGGSLDGIALKRALERVVSRHESLRTRFVLVEGEPMAVIDREGRPEWREEDLRGMSDAEGALRALAERASGAPFDLAQGPLVRACLVHLGEREHVLLVTMHHIVSDGWSMSVLENEVTQLYSAFVQGGEASLAPLPIQYGDYAAWQRERLSGDRLQALSDHWRDALLGAPARIELPTDRPRPSEQDYAGANVSVEVDPGLARGLCELSRRHGVTPYMTALAAWGILLARLSGQKDIVIGSPYAGRNRPEIEPLIGFFVNTLALRLEISGSEAVGELLAQTKACVLASQEHQDLPLDLVVDAVHPPRSLSHPPLFQVLFAWQSTAEAFSGIGDVSGSLDESIDTTAQFELTLSLQEVEGGLRGSLNYATALYDRATIERYWTYYKNILRGMVRDDSETVRRLTLMSGAEQVQVICSFNATEAEYGADTCLTELFEMAVESRPLAEAVVCGEERVSYGELNRRANQLAHHLRSLGVGPDERVALCVERSVEMVVGVLGTLKAGGAYVPLDPAYPAERLRYMLQDSDPAVVLVHGATRGVLDGGGRRVIDLDGDAEQWATAEEGNVSRETSGLGPEHLAYVIYTSGSTGQPKGAMNEHRGVVNRIRWMQERYGLTESDAVIQKTPFSFDVSVWEIFWPLTSGARLVMARPEGHKDPSYLNELLSREGVTTAHFVPSMLQVFLEHEGVASGSLLRVMCSGEALPATLAARFHERLPAVELHNLYGPTEAAVDVTAWTCKAGATESFVPIGRPIANTQIYILDEWKQPVPVGVAGELYIGGVQVGRGYWRRPELTAERFVPDPYSEESGARMYKTGDLGRWLPDGAVEYLGRNDFQVKVRGFRIELGEIESQLASADGVSEVVVVANDAGDGEKRLVAYYTGKSAPTMEELRAHARTALPEYMVPVAYVHLEALPLNESGKLDRRALPAPDHGALTVHEYEPPRGEVEEQLAQIWSEVLKLDRVGRHDNFFDLGGHSLLVVRVVTRIEKALNRRLSLGAVFARPVLRDLAIDLVERTPVDFAPIPTTDRSGYLPLSLAQRRLWFLSQFEAASQAYHIHGSLRLGGTVDGIALGRALGRVVDRHESLRTRFVLVEGEPVQVIDGEGRPEWREEDLRGSADAESALRDLGAQLSGAPFDLARGPLVRACLVHLGEREHVLLVTMHHIVSDGWSMSVLEGEVTQLYSAFVQRGEAPLAPLPIQYGDYAAWQRERLSGDRLQALSDHWRNALLGAPARIELPTDRPRPLVQGYAGASEEVEIDASLTRSLGELSRRHGVTLYMTVLAAWSIVLSRLSGQSDVVIGSPFAGRGRREIEPLIGFFVNTLALRFKLTGSESVAELLAETKARVLAAEERQDLPLDLIVDVVRPPRSLSHPPLFQVLFAWQSATEGLSGLGDVRASVDASVDTTAQFELTLSLQEVEGGLRGSLNYATALYDRETIERYSSYLTNVLGGMVRDDARAVARLPLMAVVEREQVVRGFNATAVEYGADTCLSELFEAEARRRPWAEAVVCGEERVSYGELNRRANQLAHHLRSLGVGPDERVALCVERSVEMVVGVLGTLKAGGAYVPLDPAYPAERLRYMLQDSDPAVVLVHGATRGVLDGGGRRVIDLDGDAEQWATAEEANVSREASGLGPEHLAYVIYTSGSTGQPKGAMNEHRGVVNRIRWMQERYGLTESDAVIQKTPFSFDVSVWEIFWPLTSGARLVMARPEGHKDPSYLNELTERESVTTAHFVPSMLQVFLEHEGVASGSLLRVMCSGEALPATLAARFHERLPAVELHNLYGPTEAAVDVTAWTCKAGATESFVPIGRPIANTQIYILDEWKQPVPVGVAGELYIGGVQVGRGYWRRPELTAERFVPDPYSEESGARMYKTGDLGRWLPDGAVEYLGRNDFQVKVRGFRIELGEIESQLASAEGVSEVVVVTNDAGDGEKRLVAYYTGKSAPTMEELRAHARTALPEYMVPVAYVHLEALPLNESGKLDRRALPAPDHGALTVHEYEPPRGEVEEQLAQIWSEVLKLDRVGRHDNFFDLGGHSLLAVQVAVRLERSAGVIVPLSEMFTLPTVASLAERIVEEQLSQFDAQDLVQILSKK